MQHSILYLSYDGLTDSLGQSQILPYIYGLNEKGFRYTIISFEKKESKEHLAAIRQELESKNIEWHPLSYTKKPPVFSTIYDLIKLNRLVFKLFRRTPFSLVHCRSYLTSLIGLRLKRKKGSKFIFDMRGFWADERVEGGIWQLSNLVYKWIYHFFKKQERIFLKESDYIISLTHQGKKILEGNDERFSFKVAPIQVIPCCVDNKHFDARKASKTEELKKTLNIQSDQFIIGYVGSIGTWYMLSEMMDFFKVFSEMHSRAIFLFVSKEEPKTIEDAATQAGVDKNSLRITQSSRQNMPTYIALFDWSIFFIKPVFSKQASSPTKQGELMSMSTPIICNQGIGDTDEIVTKYEGGLLVDSFNTKSYTKTISQMSHFKIQKQRVRQGSIEYFGLSNGIELYAKVYKAVLTEM